MTDGAIYSLKGKKVWVAGHRGMVGAALMRRLASEDCELLTVTRDTVDLRRQAEVEGWLAEHRPEAVFIPAARVGGILANDSFPAEFLYDNLMIEANIINAAWQNGVEKLLFLGSSCIYPKMAEQPMKEDALLTGPLEPTNQWYAVAKIAGIKLAQAYRRQYGCDFISAMPTNLYGIGDNFDLDSSHVLPALIAKMHMAKEAGDAEVVIWGTGAPKREFLYVDDCADALVFLMTHYSGEEHVNVGYGDDLTIQELAQKVKAVVGFEGALVNDTSKPDGTPRKLMDSTRLHNLGWRPRTGLDEGIAKVYRWYLETGGNGRGV
ncbi:GDP-L-fucose synthase [Parvibaculum indicum]|nr:GDP-L-fucose synthase [Parvibaculum indicum]NIJ40705.1 GDP-L-fucose synthase [Parvibaculum indicum]